MGHSSTSLQGEVDCRIPQCVMCQHLMCDTTIFPYADHTPRT